MPWIINDNILEEKNSHIIGTISPDVNPFYLRIMKITPEIFGVVEDFIETYEQHKPVLRSQHNDIMNLLEEGSNYKFDWDLDKEGNLIDENRRVLCVFKDPSLAEPVLLKFAPTLLREIKENFILKGGDAKKKPLYERFQYIRRQIEMY